MSEIESCITSFVDGRVRLRHPSLKRAEDAEQSRRQRVGARNKIVTHQRVLCTEHVCIDAV